MPRGELRPGMTKRRSMHEFGRQQMQANRMTTSDADKRLPAIKRSAAILKEREERTTTVRRAGARERKYRDWKNSPESRMKRNPFRVIIEMET